MTMPVRVVFRDPNNPEKTYPTGTKWELASNEEEVIISAGSTKLAQYSRADIFLLEMT